jgi:hypothetical protein
MVATFELQEYLRNLILYLGLVFILRWLIPNKGIDYILIEKCTSVGCKIQKNGFPERHICASIALDKQLNLNCDSKLVSLYKGITLYQFLFKIR